MWSFIFDDTAEAVCRTYHGIAGYFPGACLNDAGRPLLGLGVVALSAVALLAIVWRAARSRLSS